MKTKKCFIIYDWAGNEMPFGSFASFEDAEEFLCVFLDDGYEFARGEYVIDLKR